MFCYVLEKEDGVYVWGEREIMGNMLHFVALDAENRNNASWKFTCGKKSSLFLDLMHCIASSIFIPLVIKNAAIVAALR